MFKAKKFTLSQEVIDLIKIAKNDNFRGLRSESAIVENILREKLTTPVRRSDGNKLIEAAGRIL
jgi:hypothetical protein